MIRPERAGHPVLRRWRPTSVRTHLLALVLIPLVGLVALTLPVSQARMETARAATAIDRSVGQVSGLVAVRSALFRERFITETMVASQRLGISHEVLGRFVNMDMLQERDDRRHETERAIEQANRPDVVVVSDAVSVRERSEATTPSTTTFTEPYEEIEVRIDAAIERSLTDIRPHMEVAGAAAVVEGLSAMRAEIGLLDALSLQIQSEELLFLRLGDPEELVRKVVAGQTAEAIALHELALVSDPVIASAVTAMEADPSVAIARQVATNVVTGVAKSVGPDTDWVSANQNIQANQTYFSLAFDLLQTTTDSVRSTAGALRAGAVADLRAWGTFSAAVIVAALGVSMLLTRAISRPLRRLAHHAATLSAGDLGVPALVPEGPRDIHVTSRAFNDLVDNLRLREAKSQALADLDFDADVLARPLPGLLGHSLDRSLRALSGSITERDQLRGRILHQATHDALTGLQNRAAATEELDQALSRCRRIGRGIAVLLVDLDDFKRANDVHGHRFGDRVLIDVARRIERMADEASLVARVGGDEFLLLVEDVNDAEIATRLARRLVERFSQPTRISGIESTITACVGISFTWDGYGESDQLLAGADLAVNRAKRRAPGSIEIHDRDLQEELLAQAAVEDALQTAMRADELFLHYQPVLDLATGRMCSVEALVRWDRPGLGIQPPDSFIPVAERTNLILDLDRWVLDRAARQLDTWSTHPLLADVDMAVNVSGRHLGAQALHRNLGDLLHRTGLSPDRLVVELTETVLVDDLYAAAAHLEAVRRLGVRIALDDFGTGYTSIAHLRNLPIDIIKIDRSLVQRLNSHRDLALLTMITDLGHQLGMTITAEGVETAEQYQLLTQLGCDRAQGFHLSRPITAPDLEQWAGRNTTTAGASIDHR
jgi:diguanylate cyclase (GGDEF)-like protein